MFSRLFVIAGVIVLGQTTFGAANPGDPNCEIGASQYSTVGQQQQSLKKLSCGMTAKAVSQSKDTDRRSVLLQLNASKTKK